MTTTQIELNAPYRHKRTGGIYTTQAIAVMKSGEGQWQSCVVYNRAEDSATFVRDFEHFVQNFELVEGAPHDAAAAATAERAAFEAWAGPRWRSLERFAALDGSHYLQPELEREWLGWQARAALSSPVAAQPAVSGVDAWVETARNVMQAALDVLRTERYGSADPDKRERVIESVEGALRTHLSTALTGAAKDVK